MEFQAPTPTVKVVNQNHTAWVPYLNAGAAQINFEQLQWPIDKDVSIRQLASLLITLKVVRTRKSSLTDQTTSRDIT
jgi:hypothetical protein